MSRYTAWTFGHSVLNLRTRYSNEDENIGGIIIRCLTRELRIVLGRITMFEQQAWLKGTATAHLHCSPDNVPSNLDTLLRVDLGKRDSKTTQ